MDKNIGLQLLVPGVAILNLAITYGVVRLMLGGYPSFVSALKAAYGGVLILLTCLVIAFAFNSDGFVGSWIYAAASILSVVISAYFLRMVVVVRNSKGLSLGQSAIIAIFTTLLLPLVFIFYFIRLSS